MKGWGPGTRYRPPDGRTLIKTENRANANSSEQRELPRPRAAEGCGRDGPGMVVEPRTPAGRAEQPGDHLGVGSLAPHPGAEAGVVEPAMAHGADAIEDLLLAVGVVAAEPVLEQVGHGQGEPNDREA